MTTIKGTNNAETKYGTTAADLIYGYGGNDSLYGRAGNDQIWGGLNDDKTWGESGNDILRGEDGIDAVYGGDGNDLVYDGIGNDTLYGDGGTDKIYGDAGNDVLKGGTGISQLYGGAGIDTAHYDPSASDIDAIAGYLSGSYIEAETVYIYNKTTENGLPTRTKIWHGEHDEDMGGKLAFGTGMALGTGTKNIDVGVIQGNLNIVVVGNGGLWYRGPDYGNGVGSVTGTIANDEFHGGYGSETLKGLGGNDDFHIDGGYDLIISETNDADRFFSPGSYGTSTTVTGFNGAGVASGDVLYVSNGGLGWDGLKITEANGKTKFVVDNDPDYPADITVNAIGLKQDVDYFFV